MFKFHHDTLPDIFSDFYVRNFEISKRVTRQGNLLRVTKRGSNLTTRTIRCIGVSIYNQCFKKVNMDVSIATYKYNLKRFLLDNDVTLDIIE